MEIWKPSDEKKRKVNGVITVLGGDSTPYLDAELFFNEKREFGTRVYFKEGYKIKYVGADSVHPKSCKKAIIKSQCIRTAELTTRTAQNENSSLSKLYPEVDKALREAGLLKGKTKLPKLGTQVSDWTLALRPAPRDLAAGTSDGAAETATKRSRQ